MKAPPDRKDASHDTVAPSEAPAGAETRSVAFRTSSSAPPPADPLLLALRKRWPPQQARQRLIHELCNLLDEPAFGPAERLVGRSLLEQTEAFAKPIPALGGTLDHLHRDVSELRRRVQTRLGDTHTDAPSRRLIAIDLPDHTLGVLGAFARQHGAFLDEMLAVVFQGLAEVLAQPDAALHEPLQEALTRRLAAKTTRRWVLSRLRRVPQSRQGKPTAQDHRDSTTQGPTPEPPDE